MDGAFIRKYFAIICASFLGYSEQVSKIRQKSLKIFNGTLTITLKCREVEIKLGYKNNNVKYSSTFCYLMMIDKN